MSETTLQQLSDHVYWMTPGAPDRPSLAAVVGTQHTLMLDAGASPAHARLFLTALNAAGAALPHYVALTHWHWDHVFGAAALRLPVIAHAETARNLARLAAYDWSNEALDRRVISGEEITMCAEDIKVELPEPRVVRIARPNIVFDRSLDLHLGDVNCHIQHVGGDHASDSCVVFIQPDGVLFLGDALYEAIYTPVRHYTPQRLFPLLDAILGFGADQFIEGHSGAVLSRADLQAMAARMHLAADLVEQFGADEQAIVAQANPPLDEDTRDFVRAFIGGRTLESAADR